VVTFFWEAVSHSRLKFDIPWLIAKSNETLALEMRRLLSPQHSNMEDEKMEIEGVHETAAVTAEMLKLFAASSTRAAREDEK
jgi:hypothetical protein